MALPPISRRVKAPSLEFPFFVWTSSGDAGRINFLLGIEATEEEARRVAQSWVLSGKPGVEFGLLDRSFTTPVTSLPIWTNR